MKQTKTRFELTANWHAGGEKDHDYGTNKLRIEGSGKEREVYLANSDDKYLCKVGATLSKWLGNKRRKVKITIQK